MHFDATDVCLTSGLRNVTKTLLPIAAQRDSNGSLLGQATLPHLLCFFKVLVLLSHLKLEYFVPWEYSTIYFFLEGLKEPSSCNVVTALVTFLYLDFLQHMGTYTRATMK